MSVIAFEVKKRKARLDFESLLKLRWEQRKKYVPICERKDENPLDNFYKNKS